MRTLIATIDFGSVAVGSSKTDRTLIFNDGDGALSITSVKNATGCDQFDVVTALPCIVSPNNSGYIDIKFTPNTTEQSQCSFEITCNDPINPVASFNVSGKGDVSSAYLSISATTWNAPSGGGESPYIVISNGGAGASFSYSVANNVDWLSLSSNSSVTPDSFQITCIPNSSALSRSGNITITADGVNGSPQTIVVTQSAPGSGPILAVSPISLDFDSTKTTLSLTVSNNGSDLLSWQLLHHVPWISEIMPESGINNDTINIMVNRSGLESGNYNGYIDIQSNGGNTAVPVYITQPDLVSEFYEDFENQPLSNWLPFTDERWSVIRDESDFAYYLNTSDYMYQNGDRLGEYSLISKVMLDDFTFSCSMKTAEDILQNPLADLALLFGYIDEMNYWFVSCNADQYSSGVFRVTNGEAMLVKALTTPMLSSNMYQNISVVKRLNEISVTVAGEKIAVRPDQTVETGQFGVGSFNDAGYFDDITITNNVTRLSDNHDHQAPQHFKLYQNYPNPFNSSTTFRFEIPVPSNVKLIIYNTNGQIIKSLVNSSLPVGHYYFHWNANNEKGQVVPSGLYLCRLTSDNFTQTIKTFFIK
ncbi:T9SS type A sorting domain-containing protein [candidate division KSB1 bacterium]|nr:T9SS type A sorting domain-containing protein [candidate division KSB1 bacterium]